MRVTTATLPFMWLGRPVGAVLLDMDGTMADTKHAHAEAWEQWAELHGIGVSKEEYLRDLFGRSNEDVLPQLFPGKTLAEIRALAAEKEEVFLKAVRDGLVQQVDGLDDFVARAIARNLPVAVASSAPRRNVETIVEVFGLASLIPVRLGVEDVERAKPAPDLFQKASGLLGVPAEQCLVFEDSLHGLEASRAAGCRSIAITTLHAAECLEGHADLAVKDFRELLRLPDWNSF